MPQSEIDLAREFFEVSQGQPVPERFTTTGDGFLRMLAWYGMLRQKAKGTGGWVSKRREGLAGPEVPHDR